MQAINKAARRAAPRSRGDRLSPRDGRDFPVGLSYQAKRENGNVFSLEADDSPVEFIGWDGRPGVVTPPLQKGITIPFVAEDGRVVKDLVWVLFILSLLIPYFF